MLRGGAAGCAQGGAHYHRYFPLAARHVVDLGGLVYHLVHSQPDEIAEHNIDDGAHASHRSTDAQAGETLDKLNGIFALVEQMKAIDTTGVEPLSHPIAAIEPALALRLREDVVTESNRREDYQQPAPATQDGLYLVPKVIE